jgi:hypothetical protein
MFLLKSFGIKNRVIFFIRYCKPETHLQQWLQQSNNSYSSGYSEGYRISP